METALIYLTQLELAKELFERNRANDRRLSLILIDNCVELVLNKFISGRIKKGSKIGFNSYFPDKVDFLYRNSKYIGIEEASIFKLAHYYRNNLYHLGGQIVDYNPDFLIPLAFNKTIDLICQHHNPSSYKFETNYDSYFKKYGIEIGCPFAKDKTCVLKAFPQLKFNKHTHITPNKCIEVLKRLLKLFNDELDILICAIGEKALNQNLKFCFKEYESTENVNKRFRKNYGKYVRNLKHEKQLKKEIEQLEKKKKSPKFYHQFNNLLEKLVFLNELIQPASDRAYSVIEPKLEKMREERILKRKKGSVKSL